MKSPSPIGSKHKRMFIGAYLPQWTIVYLSLYSLAKGISKTAILKEIIGKWIIDQQQVDTEEVLLFALIDKINANWEITKVITPEVSYREYCESVRQELLNKGLQNTQVSNIMTKLKY